MKKYVPLSDQVIVRELREQQTASGIVIPDTSSEKAQRGIVLAAGEGKHYPNGEFVPMDPKIQPKKEVLFGAYAGTEIEMGNSKVIFLRQADILAVEGNDDGDDANGSEPPAFG